MMAGISPDFWRGKRVYLTGHTGFKGSWLALWLASLGADVFGYALKPVTEPSLFVLGRVGDVMSRSTIADIRDREALARDMRDARPDILFHLAAQPLVLDSYANPPETYEVNVMGTVNVLDVARSVESLRAIVIVTTDKVYDNREWEVGYKEIDPLGGHDPYSNSKACCELVTDSFRRSFFHHADRAGGRVGVATARAGNVIGGGDWAEYRLVPDFVRAIVSNTPITLRNPRSTRPWQHVLDPLSGYMALARELWSHPVEFSEAWNFGPLQESVQPVRVVIDTLCAKWGTPVSVVESPVTPVQHEAKLLSLDIAKARSRLGWTPTWTLDETLQKVVEFARAHQAGALMQKVCQEHITAFASCAGSKVER